MVAECGVVSESLSRPLSLQVLFQVDPLFDWWKIIGRELGLTNVEIQYIEENYRANNERMIRMLEKVMEKTAVGVTYRKLIEVLLNLREYERAVEVCKAITAAISSKCCNQKPISRVFKVNFHSSKTYINHW